MKHRNYETAKYFVLTFAVAFLVLMMLAVAVVMAMQSKNSAHQSIPQQPQTDDYYLPKAEDNLNLLLIGRDKDTDKPKYYFMIRLDVESGELPVAALPAQTVVTFNGKSKTLAELYALSGAKAVKQGLGELLGITVDRYASFNAENLIRAIDMIGFVEYDLPETLIFKDENISINLAKGKQMVDGQKLYDILRFPNYGDEYKRGTKSSDLLAHYINDRLEVVLSPQADELFRNVINLTDSDLSFGDYDSRKEPLRFLAKLSGKHARTVLVRGTFNASKDSFALTQSTKELMQKLYS
ncbi:LytR family transcriptional attenuator [Hydrogenoanaerobacterium saccharovorans]|uniref:Transcriptional attenuator, LytR family n=1 Tax=Hydrogenoanaerobacterium saccharovorans TaxID=474960 RepID=A0A1H8DI62_9FIRM|nr:LCP family protein [Hydrogenoanaerobacterium saccharovorans]RPF42203.1 LytR family transcriptional attenuator [Hydrogenoanaerobacterium saccharovorans]SEN06454.1 transcriptional attenuator, LytR family [Hydrogenoanaerobacterium saccharovorans]